MSEDSLDRNEKYWILVPAAGIGRRMGSEIPKQYLSIDGRTILEWTLKKLAQLKNIEALVVVLHPQDDNRQAIEQLPYSNLRIVDGGEERFDSVMNGLEVLRSSAQDNDWILVHDAVRPCVLIEDIERLINSCSKQSDVSGGLLASVVKDTLKKADEDNMVEQTLDRQQHWLAATPQMFRYGQLLQAMEAARENATVVTDEASAMEAMGHKVMLVEGSSDNIKVTHPADLPLVEFVLKASGAQDAF